ncbi:hypothetical protein [Neobacillus mesonae]|uniref:hypothetical protein n=1 Tax=Neobacillus mesonae TaxID=1193713 RepID=UPI00203BEB5E|nr:hypothetical protein [Neobacillus mesonae]MCM3570672.1 hypothetical protein [Neobacillus mesonae]
MGKIADLCWQGLTLQHVSHKKVVIPYLLFVFMTLLFELFLMVFFIGAWYWSYSFEYRPGLGFFISGGVLVLMMVGSVGVLARVWRDKLQK